MAPPFLTILTGRNLPKIRQRTVGWWLARARQRSGA